MLVRKGRDVGRSQVRSRPLAPPPRSDGRDSTPMDGWTSSPSVSNAFASTRSTPSRSRTCWAASTSLMSRSALNWKPGATRNASVAASSTTSSCSSPRVPRAGPRSETEFEIEIEADDETPADDGSAAGRRHPDGLNDPSQMSGDAASRIEEIDAAELSAAQRRELLMAAARRLTATDDPTALSYVLTALIQVDLSARQDLLEVPDTVARLAQLDWVARTRDVLSRTGPAAHHHRPRPCHEEEP